MEIQQFVLLQQDIHMQKNEVETIPYNTHKKINSKWIIDLNIRAKTVKFLEENNKRKNAVPLLEENIWVSPHDIGLDKGFLDTTTEGQITKKIGKLDFIKIENFGALKGTIQKI